MTTTDPYAASARQTTEGRVYTITGGDWDDIVAGSPFEDERRSYQ